MAMSGSQGGGGGGWFSGLWGRRQQPTTPKTPPPDKVKVIEILVIMRVSQMSILIRDLHSVHLIVLISGKYTKPEEYTCSALCSKEALLLENTCYYLFINAQGTSLSRLFVNFLESESTPVAKPHPPILPTSSTATPPGYIDPRTDPDRPSLATAPLLKPHPLHTTPSHTPSGGDGSGVPKSIPDQKPSPIPIPKLTTSHSIDSRQVAKGHESQPLEQSTKQQNASSSLFLFTPAQPNSADSAGSAETNQVSRSSQSSILRNVLS